MLVYFTVRLNHIWVHSCFSSNRFINIVDLKQLLKQELMNRESKLCFWSRYYSPAVSSSTLTLSTLDRRPSHASLPRQHSCVGVWTKGVTKHETGSKVFQFFWLKTNEPIYYFSTERLINSKCSSDVQTSDYTFTVFKESVRTRSLLF